MAYGNGGAVTSSIGPMMPGEPYKIGGPGFDSAPPPIRTSQTQTEAERLVKATELLHLMLNELEGRLADVLAPEPGNKTTTEAHGPESPVALARHIGRLAERVEHATSRIKSLMDRIEV